VAPTRVGERPPIRASRAVTARQVILDGTARDQREPFDRDNPDNEQLPATVVGHGRSCGDHGYIDSGIAGRTPVREAIADRSNNRVITIRRSAVRFRTMEYGVVAVWLVCCHALALLGLPVAAAVFDEFPNDGAAFGFPIAAVVVTLVTYWLGQLRFGPLVITAAVLVLLALDLAVLRRGVTARFRTYRGPAVVFTVVFLAVVAVRAVDPAIYAHSGEMFLNFGLLKSLERAASLPPTDVWLAGQPVRYYYGGHLLGSVLATLTATPARYAYNLHLPTILAALATASYGLAGAIGAGHGVSHRVAGLAGVFFTSVASNTFGAVQLLLRELPAALATDAARLLNLDPALVTTAEFSYTQGSGFLPHFAPLDFPLFSTFHGGFHPHVMSPPFLLTLGSLLLAYVRTPATEQRRRWALLGLTAPVTGFVLFTNSWSFPTACGLVLLAVALAPAHPRTLLPWWSPADGDHTATGRPVPSVSTDGGRRIGALGREVTRVLGGFAVAAWLGICGIVLVTPYVGRLTGGLELGLFPDRSGLAVLVLLHGAFLTLFVVYLWPHLRAFLTPTESPTAGASQRVVETRRSRRLLTLLAASVGANVLFIGTALDAASFAVYGTLLVVGWLLVRRASVGFEGVLLVAGAGLVVLVDVAYLDDPASIGRYNTVFKAYAQVWILWGMAAGVALTRILARGRDAGEELLWLTESVPRPRVVAAGVLVVSLSLWGGVAAANHFTGTTPLYGPMYGQVDDPTLDALEPEGERHPEEMAAIRWLDDRPGQPTIVEAVGNETYRWHANPASTLTGLPTIAGWKHAADYHGESIYREQASDVRAVYGGSVAERTRVLDRYGVRYVYVGPTERERYGDVPFARQRGVSVAFENEAVTIYAVDQSTLGS